MRAFFAAAVGGFMLVGAALPTVPIYWPLVAGAVLLAVGAGWLLYPWIEGRSGIDALTAAALHPNRQVDRDERIIAVANRAQVIL